MEAAAPSVEGLHRGDDSAAIAHCGEHAGTRNLNGLLCQSFSLLCPSTVPVSIRIYPINLHTFWETRQSQTFDFLRTFHNQPERGIEARSNSLSQDRWVEVAILSRPPRALLQFTSSRIQLILRHVPFVQSLPSTSLRGAQDWRYVHHGDRSFQWFQPFQPSRCSKRLLFQDSDGNFYVSAILETSRYKLARAER